MDRTVPDRQIAAERRFNQQIVIRSVSSVQQALGHSNSRNSRVVSTLCYFSLMSSTQRNLVNQSVSIHAAGQQFFRSHDGNQAAHYLPGQIMISTRFPWHLISDHPTGLRLQSLFADVENLPPNFNKTDSSAERKGLLETFRRASEVILHDMTPKGGGHINRDWVRRIYDEVWVQGATKAYFDALAQKELMPGVPELEKDSEGNILNLAERTTAPDSAWNFDEQKDILKRYIETMRTAPNELLDGKMAEIERNFKP